jgi:ATP-dependent DNA ligase
VLIERRRRSAARSTRTTPSTIVEPAGPGWVHEIKHDGFRMMVRRDAAGVRLLTARDE